MAADETDGNACLIPAGIIESCAKSFCEAIELVIKNQTFNAGDFESHKLFLSEAYCLLWHDAGTGDVDGRKSSLHLRTGALAAVIIDLLALKKIKIFSNEERVRNGKPNHLTVEVADATPTGSYLDDAVFTKMLLLTQERPEKPRHSLFRWLEKYGTNCSVTITLGSLVKRGVLGEESTGFFGNFLRYPTKDPSVECALRKELKKVALRQQRPDSYLLSLITLARTADDFYNLHDPILEKHFSKDDYKIAKRNIKAIIRGQALSL